MLTEKELEGFGVVFQGCCGLGLLPYNWNPRTKTLSSISQLPRVLISIASLLFKWSYCAFKLYRIPGFLETPNWKSEGTVYYVYQVCYLSTSLMFYNSIVQKAGVANVVNSIINFNRRQGKRYFGIEFGKPSTRETFVLVSLASLTNFTGSLVLYFYLFPNQHQFLYSAVGPSIEHGRSDWTFWIFLVLEAYTAYSLVMVYTFGVVIQFMYIVTMKFWLQRVCVDWPSQRRNGSKAVEAEDLLSLYRQMKLINAEYNRSHSHLMTPALILGILFQAIGSCYSTIRFVDSLPLAMSFVNVGMFVLATTQLIVGTSLAASLHTLSGACQQHFRELVIRQRTDIKGRLRLLKEVNMCRPFGFQVGSCYVIKRATKGTVLNLLINVVAGMLVSKH